MFKINKQLSFNYMNCESLKRTFANISGSTANYTAGLTVEIGSAKRPRIEKVESSSEEESSKRLCEVLVSARQKNDAAYDKLTENMASLSLDEILIMNFHSINNRLYGHELMSDDFSDKISLDLSSFSSHYSPNCNNYEGSNYNLDYYNNWVLDGVIEFLKKHKEDGFLSRVDSIKIGRVTQRDSAQVQKLLNILPSTCPHIGSIYFGNIWDRAEVTIPGGLTKLTSIYFGDIYQGASIKFAKSLPSLTSIFCGDIGHFVTLIFNVAHKNLTSFNCGNIGKSAKVTFCGRHTNFANFSCGDIWPNAIVRFTEGLTNFTSFKSGNIDKDANIFFPKQLPAIISYL